MSNKALNSCSKSAYDFKKALSSHYNFAYDFTWFHFTHIWRSKIDFNACAATLCLTLAARLVMFGIEFFVCFTDVMLEINWIILLGWSVLNWTWHVSSGQRNNLIESGQSYARNVGTSVGILEEIALKSGSIIFFGTEGVLIRTLAILSKKYSWPHPHPFAHLSARKHTHREEKIDKNNISWQ